MCCVSLGSFNTKLIFIGNFVLFMRKPTIVSKSIYSRLFNTPRWWAQYIKMVIHYAKFKPIADQICEDIYIYIY